MGIDRDNKHIVAHNLGSAHIYSGAAEVKSVSLLPTGSLHKDTVHNLQALWHFRGDEIRTIIETIHALVMGGESWVEIRLRLNPKR